MKRSKNVPKGNAKTWGNYSENINFIFQENLQ